MTTDSAVQTERLYAAPDAAVWAEEFMKNFGHRLEDVDEGLMIGWFANAFATQEAKDHRAKTLVRLAHMLKDERPFTFDIRPGDDGLKTVVYQAVGAASNCWERDGGQGVFQDDWAVQIAEQLIAYVESH